MMPAERDDYCTWCGTAPCTHPSDTVARPTRTDMAWLVTLMLTGWLVIAVAAVIL